MRDYGIWGSHNELLEAWWDQVLQEAAKSPRLTESERLLEAETKIDFADWLHGYVATSFYNAYQELQSQWRKYAAVKPLRDFKINKIKGRNRLTGFGYVGDHAHKPGMRRSFRPEASIFIDTYGAQHEVTRQAIINQESDEFLRDDPQDMGSAAADFLARALIALIVSNPLAPDGSVMYSSGRGNQVTTELSESTLLAAWTSMQTQFDDDGRPIRIEPRYAIVQNKTMGSVIDRAINSQFTGVTQASGGAQTVEKGTLNVVARQGIPADFTVEEPYLPDANDWYMVADPDKLPAYMVGLLRGQEEPAIYQSSAQRRAVSGGGISDPYQLRIAKIEWEVEWDLGLSAIEPRATFRGTPA